MTTGLLIIQEVENVDTINPNPADWNELTPFFFFFLQINKKEKQKKNGFHLRREDLRYEVFVCDVVVSSFFFRKEKK